VTAGSSSSILRRVGLKRGKTIVGNTERRDIEVRKHSTAVVGHQAGGNEATGALLVELGLVASGTPRGKALEDQAALWHVIGQGRKGKAHFYLSLRSRHFLRVGQPTRSKRYGFKAAQSAGGGWNRIHEVDG
jgi:hypothetical protein